MTSPTVSDTSAAVAHALDDALTVPDAETAMGTLVGVRLGDLHPSLGKNGLNARLDRPDLSDESEVRFRASLASRGLITPLNVVPATDGSNGRDVRAGERRRSNLMYMAEHGALVQGVPLTLDSIIPCLLKARDEDDTEVSVAENFERLAMKPWDVYLGFKRMVRGGRSSEQVAFEFGLTIVEVEKFLRLGSVHRSIMSKCRTGEVSLDVVHVYALTPDTKRQKAVFEALGPRASTYEVKRALKENTIDSGHALARFVGIDAYVAAGGKIERQLLAPEVTVLDVPLMTRLADERLARAAKGLGPWGWREVGHPGTVMDLWGKERLPSSTAAAPPKLLARLARIEARVAEIEGTELSEDSAAFEAHSDALDAETRTLDDERSRIESIVERRYTTFDVGGAALAGCVVTYDRQGKLIVARGVLRPADAKKYRAALQKGQAPGALAPPKKKGARSAAFAHDLGCERRDAECDRLAEVPEVAILIHQFDLCHSVLGQGGYGASSGPYLAVSADVRRDSRSPTVRHESIARDALDARRKTLDLSWRRSKSPAAQLDAFSKLDPSARDTLVAWCVAKQYTGSTARTGSGALPASIAERLATEHAKYWRPTVENYFGRCRRDMLVAHGTEWYGKGFKAETRKLTLKSIAARFGALFGGDDKALSAAERKIRDEWLPKELS